MRLTKVTGLPTRIHVTCGLQKTQSVHNGLGSTVVSVLLTAHGIWTRGCSHFTTVFGHAAPLNFIAAIVPPGNTSTPSLLRQLGAVWERSNLLERGTACILPGTSARYVFAHISVVYLSWQCSFKGCGSGCCLRCTNVQVCAAHQHGTIAQSARTEVVVVCGQAHLHLLFVSLFWSALLSHCVVVDAPHLNVPLGICIRKDWEVLASLQLLVYLGMLNASANFCLFFAIYYDHKWW
jgi:hypothetical protein